MVLKCIFSLKVMFVSFFLLERILRSFLNCIVSSFLVILFNFYEWDMVKRRLELIVFIRSILLIRNMFI